MNNNTAGMDQVFLVTSQEAFVMTRIINCYSKIKLEGNDFAAILGEMNKNGWHSVIWKSKIRQLAMMGIKTIDEEMLKWISFNKITNEVTFTYRADIFMKDGELYYLMIMKDNHGHDYSTIEAGVITKTKDANYPMLGPLVRAFTAALKQKIDGRRARHMKLGWLRYSENEEIDGYVFSKKFSYPVLNDTIVKAAICLCDPIQKKLLLQIALLRAGQFKNKFSSTSTIVDLTELERVGLIHQTTVSGDFSLTILGRSLLNGSHWMTVWLTQLLIRKGVPEKSIIWHVSEDEEEVDVAVQFKGKVWIIELKDRNFEAGDAHPFLYRSVKFKADKTIIISTGKISNAAKKVFDDLFRNASYPLCMEGLEKAADMFEKLITNTILYSVLEKCKDLSKEMHINLQPLFTKLYGKYLLEKKGEYADKSEYHRYKRNNNL